MIRKFLNFLLFLILLHRVLSEDVSVHVDHKFFAKNVKADSDAPVIIDISATSACVIQVYWDCSSTCHENLNEFTVYWQQTGSEKNGSASVNSRSNYYNIEGLIADQSYTAWVASVKDDGEHSSDSMETSTNPSEVPQKVNGVEAVVKSDSIIILSWENTSNPCPIKGYSLTWNGIVLWDETVNIEGMTNVDESTTSYEVAYLTPYTEYEFYVSKITTDDIKGEPSDPSGATTKQGPAGPPESVTSRNLSFSSVEVSWTPPNEKNGVITGYHISCQLLPDPENHCDNIPETIDDFYYTVNDLKGCGEYIFSVYAVNGGGNGEEGTSVSTTNPDAPPDFTSFICSNISSTSVLLIWEPLDTNFPVLKYFLDVVEEVLWSGKTDSFSQEFTTEGNIYLFDYLIPWSLYNVSIKATTEGGTTESISTTLVTLEDAAGPPTIVNITPNGSHSVWLNWTAPEEQNGDISQYRISCTNELLGLDHCRGRTESDVFSYMSEGLDACGKYTFRVYAVNGFGDGVDDKRKSTTDPESPPPVTQLKVVEVNMTSITITFVPPATTCPVLSYYVKGEGDIISSHDTKDYISTFYGVIDTYNLNGLIPNTNYVFYITATTDGGTSDPVFFTAQTPDYD